MTVNWSLGVNQSNPFMGVQQGFQQGREFARQRGTDEAVRLYAGDPQAGIEAMNRFDPFVAAKMEELQTQREARKTRASAGELVKEGKYTEAAKAVFATDPDFARTVLALGEAEREIIRERSERGGAILAASLGLPAAERRAFVEANGGDLYSPEQIAGFDFNDDRKIAAEAYRTMGIKDLVGSYSVETVGDNLRTYHKSPFGIRQVGKDEAIPETREEKRRREDTEADNRRQAERDAADAAYRAESLGIQRSRAAIAASNAGQPSPSRVAGALLQKMAAGIPLSPSEQQAWDAYKASSVDPYMAQLLSGGPVAPPQPRPAPPAPGAGRGGRGGPAPVQAGPGRGGRGGPAPAAGAPPRVSSDADYNRLPSGTVFIDPEGRQRRKP